ALCGILPKFAQLYGAVLRVDNYPLISATAFISFSLVECLWVWTVRETAKGRNEMLRVVFELEKTLDTEMSSVKCNQLTDWFSRRFLCTTVYLRATCLGQLSVVFQFIVSIC